MRKHAICSKQFHNAVENNVYCIFLQFNRANSLDLHIFLSRDVKIEKHNDRETELSQTINDVEECSCRRLNCHNFENSRYF